MRISFLIILAFICGLKPLFAQKINADYKLHIRKASSEIHIDGVLDEKAWEDAEVATDFYMITPMDTSFAQEVSGQRNCFLYGLFPKYRGQDRANPSG